MVQNVARVGRPGLPSEIASAIVFLASPTSCWIRGQDIVIDGGMSAIATSEALGL
ncbi:SDR family oxidoreductase [Pseudosulfitobacter sp. SM2401]|uniref:SDR family oxidoreductase n=1 Tax=Pseudosulfitobacter sp. SM2401 TaxID=3350098 RepID=UPI0036F3B9C3